MGFFSRKKTTTASESDSNYTPPTVDDQVAAIDANISVESGSGSDEEAMIITSPSKDQDAEQQKDPEKGEVKEAETTEKAEVKEAAVTEETVVEQHEEKPPRQEEEPPRQEEVPSRHEEEPPRQEEQEKEKDSYVSVEKQESYVSVEKSEVALMKPRENTAAAASLHANLKASREKTMIEKGPYYIHVLGFLGGVAMIVLSVLDWVKNSFHQDITHAFIAVYTILFGCIICILEEEQFVPEFIGGATRSVLHRNVNMLQHVWGRGLLFFCAGSLQLAQMTFFSEIAGGFMMVLGLIALYYGREAQLKLYNLRESISDESQLQQIFNENDASGDGYFELGDFSNLADQIGLELAKGDAEEAFASIDKDRDGKLSFDEFKNWWSTYKFDTAKTNMV